MYRFVGLGIRVQRADMIRLAETVYPNAVENATVLFYYFAHQAGVRNHVLVTSRDESAPVALVFSPLPEEQFLQNRRSTGDTMESAFFNGMRLLLADPRYSQILGNAPACWLVKIPSWCEDISSVSIVMLQDFIVEFWGSFDNAGGIG